MGIIGAAMQPPPHICYGMPKNQTPFDVSLPPELDTQQHSVFQAENRYRSATGETRIGDTCPPSHRETTPF